LSAGTIGCNGGSGTYSLTVASTAGGAVTVPGEGTFSYSAGTLVQLLATPAHGYRFQSWTGDSEEIADYSSASTNITINSACSITANFVEEGGLNPVDPHQ
jgi:hypothetical protein